MRLRLCVVGLLVFITATAYSENVTPNSHSNGLVFGSGMAVGYRNMISDKSAVYVSARYQYSFMNTTFEIVIPDATTLPPGIELESQSVKHEQTSHNIGFLLGYRLYLSKNTTRGFVQGDLGLVFMRTSDVLGKSKENIRYGVETQLTLGIGVEHFLSERLSIEALCGKRAAVGMHDLDNPNPADYYHANGQIPHGFLGLTYYF